MIFKIFQLYKFSILNNILCILLFIFYTELSGSFYCFLNEYPVNYIVRNLEAFLRTGTAGMNFSGAEEIDRELMGKEVQMADTTMRGKLEGIELKMLCIFSMILLLAAGVAGMVQEREGIVGVIKGLWTIVVSRDALITDYFELAGYGASFMNAVLVMGISICLLYREKVKFTGLTMAAISINAGYALWGKNPVNILPILIGSSLYAKVHGSRLGRYLYTAMFGTSLAPLVTELIYLLPFDRRINLAIATLTGILIGFILPVLSVHTASMHKGFSLFNVGFSAGVLAFVMVCILKSFGLESESVMIWREGRPLWIVLGLYGYFLLTFLFGLYLTKGNLTGIRKIWKHPGRAVADFILMEGVGSTLMNMALVGAVCETYILLVGGDLSGPVVGAILTAYGFAAFGAHVKNYLPVLCGVFLSTFLNQFTPTMPGLQLAAIFAVGLAPIAGRFGVLDRKSVV